MNKQRSILHPLKATHHNSQQKHIYDFLREHRIGVLSTVTPDNDPHGTVIYYTIDEDFVLHLLTKAGTRKYDNMIHHDHVMLTVFDPKLQTVAQVTGIASERGGSKAIDEIVEVLFEHKENQDGDGLPPIVKLQAGPFTTFQIQPTQLRMANYARPDTGSYEQLFETVDR